MDTKKLRQKILDLAIHGKLVPQDPNDEPASVLLERIRAEKEQLIKAGKIKKSKASAKTSDTPLYENVPFEVPEGWSICKLMDVCSFENGFAFSSNDYTTTGTPLIRISNIKDGIVSLEECVCVGIQVDDRFCVRQGDLLIALSGATTGKMGVYNDTKPAYLNQRVGNLNVFSDKYLNPQFRDIFMLSKVSEILKLAYGGAQPNISGNVILNFDLLLPPLAEQQRIVAEVNKWFALIDIIEQGKDDLQATIAQAKSKILDLAIHGKLVPQDPSDEPAIELLRRINPKFTPCDNGHYTQLPHGWCITMMSELCRLSDGEHITGKAMTNLEVKYLRGEREAKTLMEGRLTKSGSLMILVDGENSGEVFKAPHDGYQGSTFKQLTIIDTVVEDYILLIINSHKKSLKENKVGSAIPHLNKKLFKEIKVLLPPIKEQQRIVKAYDMMESILSTMMESL